MSIPHRASDGCIIGKSLCSYTTIPFWLLKGEEEWIEVGHCPTGKHTRIKIITKIKLLSGRVIGEYIDEIRGGTRIRVFKHADLKYFFRRKVYCIEHEVQHY